MVSVSSDFQEELESKNPTLLQRKFTIGSSDYTERVLKWPSISWSTKDIRPKGVVINLANSDKVFSFFRDDKTTMRNECEISYSMPVLGTGDYDISTAVFLDKRLNVGKPVGIAFNGDGSLFFVISSQNDQIFEYTLSTNFDTSTAVYAGKNISVFAQEPNPTGIAFNNTGSSMYIVGATDRVQQYTLSTEFDINTATYAGKFIDVNAQESGPQDVTFNNTGSLMYVVGAASDKVHQYSLSTEFDVSTAIYNSVFKDISPQDVAPVAVIFNNTGSSMYVLGLFSGKVYQYSLSTEFDVSTATYTGKFMDANVWWANSPDAILFNDVGTLMYITDTITGAVYQYSVEDAPATVTEDLVMFAGDVGEIKYDNEKCSVRLIDKFRNLSDRKVGDTTDAVNYTTSNYLGSDLAWYICTSHGGLSSIESSSNPDIDYDSFNTWAAVFSGDNILMQGLFEGQTCTELLRKISRHTASTIYVREGKMFFKRLNIAEPVSDIYDSDNTFDVGLSFRTDDLINTQSIAGGFTADSGHLFTVTQVNSASIGDFGPKEDLLKDDNIWFINSGTAINHAQRVLYFNSNPDDKLSVDVPLNGALRSIGETVTITDSFHAFSENYLVEASKVDMEKSNVNFSLTKILLQEPFILDTTSLGSLTEVLT